MVNQLPDVARIRSGHFTLRLKRADMGEVCRAIADEVETGRGERRIRIDCNGDTWGGDFDVDRISQVVSNLVGNALQHGDQALPILVTVDGSEITRIRVGVVNGGHVPADALAHIFEPFKVQTIPPRHPVGSDWDRTSWRASSPRIRAACTLTPIQSPARYWSFGCQGAGRSAQRDAHSLEPR